MNLSDLGRMAVSEEAVALTAERLDEQKAVPIFVYGTLRVGEGNYNWIEGGVRKIRKEATTNGTLFYPGHRGFPGARFDIDGDMVGDLIWVDPESDEFRQIVSMELGAGYSMLTVEATYDRKTGHPHRKTITALAFQHEHVDHDDDRVAGNNWLCAGAFRERGRR